MDRRAVLVVDDEPIMRFCLERLLTADGFAVRTVANAAGALDSLAVEAPDAVILDVVLDQDDGCVLCLKMREAGPKDMKIVMVSARSRPDDVEKGLAAGADAYLAKPFGMDSLRDRLAALLADGRA